MFVTADKPLLRLEMPLKRSDHIDKHEVTIKGNEARYTMFYKSSDPESRPTAWYDLDCVDNRWFLEVKIKLNNMDSEIAKLKSKLNSVNALNAELSKSEIGLADFKSFAADKIREFENKRLGLTPKMLNERAAQVMLRSIVTSQATYRNINKNYAPTLAELSSSGILRAEGFKDCTAPGLKSEVINGYIFEMTPGRTWTTTSFYIRCKPESDDTGTLCYSTDVSGSVVSTASY